LPQKTNSKLNPIRKVFRTATSISMLILVTAPVGAQERYSPFVPTEERDVVRMLRLADLSEGDVVFDLGSGDGRIVLEAARMKAGVRGRGIEMDEKLVADSRATAQATGFGDRVQFVHQNAFDADLKDATVITMWLWSEVMRMLRPKILAEAKPGTRIITRMWDLGTWPPDESTTEGTTLYKWIVPARIGGNWSWNLTVGDRKLPYSAIFEQRFQTVEGVARVVNRRALLNDVKLRGEDLSFSLLISIEGTKLVRHQFTGKVRGDAIEGTVSILRAPYEDAVEVPWRAERTMASAYLEPTGMDSEVGR
jgi:hypothetical protein